MNSYVSNSISTNINNSLNMPICHVNQVSTQQGNSECEQCKSDLSSGKCKSEQVNSVVCVGMVVSSVVSSEHGAIMCGVCGVSVGGKCSYTCL